MITKWFLIVAAYICLVFGRDQADEIGGVVFGVGALIVS